jgi:hypothetical protein
MSKRMILLFVGAAFVGGCATTRPVSPADVKREADYRTAVRKCDQMGSAERSTCIEDAKARYGVS